ncbi:peptidase inhibitor family I36 protein [Streptomyces sp. NPDC051636]|uniref:peptidase inhibitor family I36 protein n=1 Tax=Streptomyces sp. NPDC051636 TaxID=3365663 RepID=UPI0037B3AB15
MKFRGLKIAAMAVGSVALAGSLATSAQADDLDYTCNDHEVCNYRLTSYTGGIWDTGSDESNYVGWYFSNGYTLNDRTSSLKNNADIYDVAHYTNSSYSGYYLYTSTNSARSSLYSPYENAFSSHQF